MSVRGLSKNDDMIVFPCHYKLNESRSIHHQDCHCERSESRSIHHQECHCERSEAISSYWAVSRNHVFEM